MSCHAYLFSWFEESELLYEKRCRLFHVCASSTLAPPSGQSWRCIYAHNLNSYAWFSNMRYHWIPIMSISALLDFPPYWILWKRFFQSSPKLVQMIFRPSLRIVFVSFSICSKWCHILATLWVIKTNLGTWTRRPTGGEVISVVK